VAPRPKRKLQAIAASDAISDAIATAGLTAPIRAHRILTEWREMVGERVAARTWPDGLDQKAHARVLWVRVASSAWLHELTLVRQQILDGIHAVLGEPRLVDELRLHLGARKQVDEDDVLAKAAQARSRPKPLPPRPLPPPATGAAKDRIDHETAVVADPELREIIRRVRVRHDR
jgi:predicted nucleic acid-binding Zn ribbon protein